jgi:hypothetical protein
MKFFAGLFSVVLLFAFSVTSCKPKAEQKKYVRPDETDPSWEYVVKEQLTGKKIVAVDDHSCIVAFDNELRGIALTGKELWKTPVSIGKHGTEILCLMRSKDGNFLVAGSAQDTASGEPFAWLAQLKLSGELAWQKTFHGIGPFENLAETQNGDIAVSGISGKIVFLSRLKTDGELLWSSYYDGVAYQGYGLCNTPDDGFVLTAAGTTDSLLSGDPLRVIKTDKDGKLLWSKSFSVDKNPFPQQVFAEPSGNLMVIGKSTDKGEHDGPFALQIDAQGNTISVKTNYWEDDVVDVVTDVKRTAEGNYILCGDFLNFQVPRRAFVGEMDKNGTLLWSRAIGKKEETRGGTAVTVLPNGSLLTLGFRSDVSTTPGNATGISLFTIPENGGVGRKADY